MAQTEKVGTLRKILPPGVEVQVDFSRHIRKAEPEAEKESAQSKPDFQIALLTTHIDGKEECPMTIIPPKDITTSEARINKLGCTNLEWVYLPERKLDIILTDINRIPLDFRTTVEKETETSHGWFLVDTSPLAGSNPIYMKALQSSAKKKKLDIEINSGDIPLTLRVLPKSLLTRYLPGLRMSVEEIEKYIAPEIDLLLGLSKGTMRIPTLTESLRLRNLFTHEDPNNVGEVTATRLPHSTRFNAVINDGGTNNSCGVSFTEYYSTGKDVGFRLIGKLNEK